MSYIWVLTLFLTVITLTSASNPNEHMISYQPPTKDPPKLTGPNQQQPIHRKLSLGFGFFSPLVGILGEQHLNPRTLRRPVRRPKAPSIGIPGVHLNPGNPRWSVRPPPI